MSCRLSGLRHPAPGLERQKSGDSGRPRIEGTIPVHGSRKRAEIGTIPWSHRWPLTNGRLGSTCLPLFTALASMINFTLSLMAAVCEIDLLLIG